MKNPFLLLVFLISASFNVYAAETCDVIKALTENGYEDASLDSRNSKDYATVLETYQAVALADHRAIVTKDKEIERLLTPASVAGTMNYTWNKIESRIFKNLKATPRKPYEEIRKDVQTYMNTLPNVTPAMKSHVANLNLSLLNSLYANRSGKVAAMESSLIALPTKLQPPAGALSLIIENPTTKAHGPKYTLLKGSGVSVIEANKSGKNELLLVVNDQNGAVRVLAPFLRSGELKEKLGDRVVAKSLLEFEPGCKIGEKTYLLSSDSEKSPQVRGN